VDVVVAQTKALADRISDWTNKVVLLSQFGPLKLAKLAIPAHAQ